MSEADQAPRARFRHLPEPVRPEELVESSDVDRPVAAEGSLETDWRLTLLGPGTP